ncbi:MAG: HD domain-containing protein [Candidatus Latescibacteria bacterium]|jgi:(p)ppGpp synthase/HD superfamily hydrolase|nr:HD domain-containing protein [Candidatus Latescibacterota bacterium]
MPGDPKAQTRFEEAIVFAHRLHAGQVRKASNTPYIAHLLSVASLVLEAGGSQDEAVAALLHDAVEDQGGREVLAEIRRRFGDAVARIVEGCSDTDRTPKPPWRERKVSFIASLADATPEVRRVTAADKLHNVLSLLWDYRKSGDTIWDVFNGGKEGTLWYYREVACALGRDADAPLAQELSRAVAELDSLVDSPTGGDASPP